MNNDANLDLIAAFTAAGAAVITADTDLADISAAIDAATGDDTIEANDTVRYTGKTTRWTVEQVYSDGTLEVSLLTGSFRRGGTVHTRFRTVARDRVELVRKGNRTDDQVAALFIETGN